MRAIAVLLAGVALAGCQSTGIRGDLSTVKQPAAMQIGYDSANLFRDQFAVDSAVWHVANEGKTTVRSASRKGFAKPATRWSRHSRPRPMFLTAQYGRRILVRQRRSGRGHDRCQRRAAVTRL